jgi:hypothetical protein
MPAPNNPATARIALTVDRDTRKFLNILHMARTDGGTLDALDILNMANVVADWWQNSYRHTLASPIVGESVVATKQDPGDPEQVTVFINGPGDRAASTTDPADVTGAISWRTGLAGRKFRGRFYHFAPPGNLINTNDTFQGTFLSEASATANYLLTHTLAAGFDLIVFHRSDDTYTIIISLIVDALVDSMRRRLAGRGI